jgi:large subunit ribosomal protein L10
MLAFSFEEPGAAARLLHDFMKENDQLEVKALSMDGNLMAAEQLSAVAKLPTRDEAIALLMATLNAPVTKLARTMTETYAQFVRVLSAVAEQKG